MTLQQWADFGMGSAVFFAIACFVGLVFLAIHLGDMFINYKRTKVRLAEARKEAEDERDRAYSMRRKLDELENKLAGMTPYRGETNA